MSLVEVVGRRRCFWAAETATLVGDDVGGGVVTTFVGVGGCDVAGDSQSRDDVGAFDVYSFVVMRRGREPESENTYKGFLGWAIYHSPGDGVQG
jgi:hypothetical protein